MTFDGIYCHFLKLTTLLIQIKHKITSLRHVYYDPQSMLLLIKLSSFHNLQSQSFAKYGEDW